VAPLDPARTAAIVTGHSRGIGEAIADQLLTRGASVLGIARQHNERLAGRFPALQQIALDLSDARTLDHWLGSDALARFIGDAAHPVLVNNAGALQPIGPLETQNTDTVTRTVMLNVGAALAFSAAFARVAVGDDRRILHISSGAGRKAYAGWSVYCATKAALDHHARCVVRDESPGLRIASVAPGVVDTEMQAEIRRSSDDRFPDRPRFVAMHREHTLPSPDTVARRLTDFLLSDTFGAEPVFDLRDFAEHSPLSGR
jgi:hypothetical protein